MSAADVIEHDDVDTEVPVAHSSVELDDVVEQVPGAGSDWRGWGRKQFGAVQGWSTRKRWGVGIGTGLVGLMLLGQCGGDDPKPSTDTTLTAETDPLDGRPTLSPIVMAAIRPADRADFARKLSTLVADGTSVCDVFFGVKIIPATDAQPVRLVWSLATPASQAADLDSKTGAPLGFELPSSAYPVRAFYGAPCNVPARDVRLKPATPTNVATATSVTAAATSTTKPASPVSGG